MLKNVVDGFTYNAALQYLPNRYFPNALAQMDILRRASNYRARWFVVPDDIDQPIEPYDTLYFQLGIADGSYLWGYSFSAISATIVNTDGETVDTEVSATDLLLQLVDSCTGVPLAHDFFNAGGAHSDGTTKLTPILLTQPRLILNPGLVNVEVSNRTAKTITCQWLLHFAEPCWVVTEEERGRMLWAAR